MNRLFLMFFAGLAFALTVAAGQKPKVTSIRQIDFKNFVYAWSEAEPPQDHEQPWHWLTEPPDSEFRAIHGRHRFHFEDETDLELKRSPLVSVCSVTLGDLDGDGIEEAVVSLNYSTGGTQNWDYIYVYRLESERTNLIARMRTGSRGYGGLVKALVRDGLLVIDFADPEKRVGDCCSEGFIRVRYRWQEDHFEDEGERGHGKLHSQEGPPRPRFSDYAVKTVYHGRPARPIITKEFRTFRTMIRRGARSPVQFAGHYTVAGWGCGTDCNGFVVVDSKTGKVYEGLGVAGLPPSWLEDYGEEAMERMEFYPDSRLMKINACPAEENCGLYDYEMVDGKGLKLIRKELLPEEYEAPTVP
jgi:hypothetical protein